jgi:hypothetical protein
MDLEFSRALNLKTVFIEAFFPKHPIFFRRGVASEFTRYSLSIFSDWR